MYKWLFLLLIISVVGCKDSGKNKEEQKVIKSAKVPLHDSVFNNIFDKDSVKIELAKDVENGDTHFYLKRNELHVIEVNYQELVKGYPLEPDVSYALANHTKLNYQDTVFSGFESEAGRDYYYLLYSYFLKTRNGEEEYKGMRDTLREIFRTINGINEGLVRGGTYFGHQHKRIEGYIEYAIYTQIGNTQSDWYKKDYSINAQKEYFIKLLKQRVVDEVNNSGEYWGQERVDAFKEFFSMLSKLNNLITNYFYLKKAQEFQYAHY